MRKKIFLPLLVLVTLLLLAGCKKEPTPVDPTPPPIEEPVVEVDENEKEVIMTEFEALIDSDKDPEEVIGYINTNIAKLSPLEGDKMIDSLEKKLENNIETLTDRLFELDSDNELINIAGTEPYFPEDKVDEIKNVELKAEVTKTFDNMYRLVNIEGGFYPVIDYTKLQEYDNNISDEWKEYLAIRAMDSDSRPFSDGGITISWEDLADRILKTENFLNKYIAGPRQEELLDLYENKLTAYMKGLPNTPIADPANKKISEDVLKSYETTSNMEGYITAHVVYQYIEAIKANNLTIDNGILNKADELINEAVSMLKEFK